MTKKDGLLLKGIGGFYYVETADGVYECKARGSFRNAGLSPLPGDYVTIRMDENAENRLETIKERKNFLVRPPIANLDQLLIVVAMADPAPNLFIIDKLIAIAERKQIEPILVFNKTDLGSPDKIMEIYRNAGYRCVAVSTSEQQGVAEIRRMLNGKISAFTGNSGVGKSTLLNAIDSRLALQTGEISKKLGRGRHTTRHAELFHVAGGYVADTAGFSSLDMEQCEVILKEELPGCFREFEPFLGQCKFSTCAHIHDKGCAVLQALADGVIAPSRHESYQMLYDQVKDLKEWNLK